MSDTWDKHNMNYYINWFCVPSYTSAIVWDAEHYYVLDSKSRNECGMRCAETSVLTVNVLFKLCAVSLYKDIPDWESNFESSSESGSCFDPVSDSELLLPEEKLQEINDLSQTDVDDCSVLDLINETLASRSLLDDSTLCVDETVLKLHNHNRRRTE